MSGTLFVVSTPLGNSDDISARAVRTLKEADLVVAEDTRSAQRLLSQLGFRKTIISCFDANEAARAAEVVDRLREGMSVALVSEAGTPAISDPGHRVVRAAIEAGVRVVPVPGASAVLSALVASGLPTDRFLFAGFPPRKDGPRRKAFAELAHLPFTLVFYESPLRTGATLRDMANAFGPARPACVARELTKTYEELVRGGLGELAERYATDRPLGEVTLVVGGAAEDQNEGATDEDLAVQAQRLLAAGHSPRDAANALAEATGRPRRDVYRIVLAAVAR